MAPRSLVTAVNAERGVAPPALQDESWCVICWAVGEGAKRPGFAANRERIWGDTQAASRLNFIRFDRTPSIGRGVAAVSSAPGRCGLRLKQLLIQCPKASGWRVNWARDLRKRPRFFITTFQSPLANSYCRLAMSRRKREPASAEKGCARPLYYCR